MDLEIQIQSLITSFLYGMFISLTYNIFYFILYSKNKVISIVFNALFSLSLSILYFYIMLKINNAHLHIYFLLILMLGFIIGNHNTKKVRSNHKRGERA